MGVKKWLWSKFSKKIVKAGVSGLLALIGAERLTSLGLNVDQTQLVIGLLAIIEGLRNWLKVKAGVKWL